jgi:hypothetical protein
MTELQDNLAGHLVAAKLELICNLARNAVKIEMRQSTLIDFRPLLDRCEDFELYLEGGCLNFGLSLMAGLLYLGLHDFIATACSVTDDLGKLLDDSAKGDLFQALKLCREILELVSTNGPLKKH